MRCLILVSLLTMPTASWADPHDEAVIQDGYKNMHIWCEGWVQAQFPHDPHDQIARWCDGEITTFSNAMGHLSDETWEDATRRATAQAQAAAPPPPIGATSCFPQPGGGMNCLSY